MNSITHPHQLNPNAIGLCSLGRHIANKGWLPASGGNLSIRSGEHGCLIPRAGKDKGELSPKDLLQISWSTATQWRVVGNLQPSADTALHIAIYQLYPSANVVLHTQSVSATVLSRLVSANAVTFHGYDMQKAVVGVSSHDQVLQLPLFDHTPQLPTLAALLQQTHQELAGTGGLPAGFLVRGHGLYVWGDSLDDAKRHVEAYEFLLACELERLKIQGLR